MVNICLVFLVSKYMDRDWETTLCTFVPKCCYETFSLDCANQIHTKYVCYFVLKIAVQICKIILNKQMKSEYQSENQQMQSEMHSENEYMQQW
jgi:hypothetical protein